MKWSLKLGRILGIKVYVHFTFLLLLAFVGLGTWASARSLGAALSLVAYLLALFTCVLLHEYGHALAARGYGIGTHDITLLPIGGLARLEKMPDKPAQELWVALAGPAVNVVIAGGLFVGLALTGKWQSGDLFNLQGGNFVKQLLGVNIMLVLFNLLPAFPMDGGRVLRALLAMRMDYSRATSIAATIGQGMAVLFGFAGLFFNPMLLFIALFVWIGAGQEASATEMKSSLEGARVRDAMLTEFRVLSPSNTLADAARMLLAGSQQDFPVVRDGHLMGIVSRSALLKGLRESGDSASVEGILSRDIEVLSPNEPLEPALSRAQGERGAAMPVVQDGQLVGLVTAENIGEYFMIRSALGRQRRTQGPPPLPPVIVRERL
jgi:Zn-dependent protease/predicted transcriptional regulator